MATDIPKDTCDIMIRAAMSSIEDFCQMGGESDKGAEEICSELIGTIPGTEMHNSCVKKISTIISVGILKKEDGKWVFSREADEVIRRIKQS